MARVRVNGMLLGQHRWIADTQGRYITSIAYGQKICKKYLVYAKYTTGSSLLAHPSLRRQPSRKPPGAESAPLRQHADRQGLPEGHGTGNAVAPGPGAVTAGAAPQAERVQDDGVPGNKK